MTYWPWWALGYYALGVFVIRAMIVLDDDDAGWDVLAVMGVLWFPWLLFVVVGTPLVNWLADRATRRRLAGEDR